MGTPPGTIHLACFLVKGSARVEALQPFFAALLRFVCKTKEHVGICIKINQNKYRIAQTCKGGMKISTHENLFFSPFYFLSKGL